MGGRKVQGKIQRKFSLAKLHSRFYFPTLLANEKSII